MKISLNLSHKALSLVAVPLLFELVFLTVLTGLLRQAEYEIWREHHAKAVISESNALLKNFLDSGFALYMYATSGADPFLLRYQELSEQIKSEIRTLKILIKDSPNPEQSLLRLEKVSKRATELLAQGSRIVNEGKVRHGLIEEKASLEEMLSELASELRVFVREQEHAEKLDPNAESRSRMLIMQCLTAGFVFNIVLAVFLAAYFNRDITRRLRVLMENTERLSKGEKLHAIVKGTDEVAKLDEVFHQMAAALADAAKRKQELITMVSHDLRTPLTSVQASLTLLSEGVLGSLSERVEKEVVVAQNNTTRLIFLINDLLDFEKIEAGQMAVDFKEIAVQSIFDQASDSLQAFAWRKNVTLVFETSDLVVNADLPRLVQVLVNLTANAVKFSPADSEVRIVAESSNDYVEIRVQDQGRGIPPAFIETIFERFKQVESSDAYEKKGSGLGLAICKSLVELHGGTIGVESEEGVGSTFWFRVPKASAAILAEV
ncbi:MAG: CHASE3 domain-containing protein [Candidatus Obscuribacterales bacterium]|nr:CHASE3 domain-containing protein [Candidatus Obscuribacterales bacterium]